MSFRSLQTTLTLYRSGTLTLEEATRRSGVPEARLMVELRRRGIPVREESQPDDGRQQPT